MVRHFIQDRTAANRAGMIGSIIALAIVVVLPALSTHYFARSYRPIEAHPAAARHWSLDLNDRAVKALERVARIPSLTPIVSLPTDKPTALQPAPVVRQPINIPRLLKRLRLGASRVSDLPSPR